MNALIQAVAPILAEADAVDAELVTLLGQAVDSGKVRGVVSKAMALRQTAIDLRTLALTRLEIAEAEHERARLTDPKLPSFPVRGVTAAQWLAHLQGRLDSEADRARAEEERQRHEAEKAARAEAERREAEEAEAAKARADQAKAERVAAAVAESAQLRAESRLKAERELARLAESHRKRIML